MKKNIIPICFVILLGEFFLPARIFACRFTVREIGFTDLASQPYTLYFFADKELPEEKVETFRKISYAALLDANVQAEIINLDEQVDHPAVDFYNFWRDSHPLAVLVAPEGQSMALPLSAMDDPFKEAVWSMLESIVTSPVREQVLENIVKAYGVVLLIEGEDRNENVAKRATTEKAMVEIRRIMSQMPKPVDEPPVLITVPYDERDREEVFLWSLGLSGEDFDKPHLAILYGRGRRMGPLVKPAEITEDAIFNLLSLVGADCECGLDRSWILGTMIPLRWESKRQAEVVQRLGFDAENPMVRSEMRQVLSNSPTFLNNGRRGSDQTDDEFLGYREGVVQIESTSDVPRLSLTQIQGMNSSQSFMSRLGGIIAIIGVVVIFILAVGVLIFFKSKQKYSEIQDQ